LFGNKKSKKEILLTRDGEKNKLCFRISTLKQKAEVCQFLLTHLTRHQEIALVFSMVHSFCTQKFHFPIPFHFMLKNLNFDSVLLPPPKKGGSKAQNFTNTWEANIACEFHSSSLIVVMTLERFHHSSYYFSRVNCSFICMMIPTHWALLNSLQTSEQTMWQNLSWVSITSRNRH
jgi:hypothetical protein